MQQEWYFIFTRGLVSSSHKSHIKYYCIPLLIWVFIVSTCVVVPLRYFITLLTTWSWVNLGSVLNHEHLWTENWVSGHMDSFKNLIDSILDLELKYSLFIGTLNYCKEWYRPLDWPCNFIFSYPGSILWFFVWEKYYTEELICWGSGSIIFQVICTVIHNTVF